MSEQRQNSGDRSMRKNVGWKTSEHWMTWAVNAFGSLMAMGFICTDQNGACGQSEHLWCRVLGVILIIFGQGVYTFNRTRLKRTEMKIG